VNQAQGETAVTTSALIVTGLYAYRKATEGETKAPASQKTAKGVKGYVEAPLGLGELAPLGEWATGMGFTFILLSILTSVNSTFGGSFAILVATGAVLTNGQAVLKDLEHGLNSTSAAAPAPGSSVEKPQAKQHLEPLQSNHPPAK
jgi:hypothetical protein